MEFGGHILSKKNKNKGDIHDRGHTEDPDRFASLKRDQGEVAN